jgi:hypothetical protein
MKTTKYFILGLSLFFVTAAFGQSYFTASYNMAVPMGNTSDFIDKTSWRGFSLEGGGWINNNVSLGFNFSWQGFYKEEPYQTYNFDGFDISAKVWKYQNAYPLLGVARYYFNSRSDVEFYGGGGIGTHIVNRKTEFSIYYIPVKQWQFALQPEAGLIYWFNPESGLLFNAKYAWAAKAGDLPAQSYFGVSLGFFWQSY